MNLSLDTAIDRIDLGLSVTLAFLGLRAIALAGSRSRWDLLTEFGAAASVYVLVTPWPTSAYRGLGLALIVAACRAAYILLNRLAGDRRPGLQGPAVATGLSAFAHLPVLTMLLAQRLLTGMPLLYAVAAGVLSPVGPYAADFTVLRHVPHTSSRCS